MVVALALVAATVASAQNLLDNDAYKKATELKQQAQAAFDNGQYDQSRQLSAQSEQYAKQAVDVAQQLALGYRATNWLDIAKQYYQFAEQAKADVHYPDAWKAAQPEWTLAQKSYASKDYQTSINASMAVVVALKDVRLQIASQPTLPKYYVVRLIPGNRDCFWRIAAYPFIYGNPQKWPILYQANKDKLQNPNNPDLIQPGMVFVIPSINGETRAGTYKP